MRSSILITGLAAVAVLVTVIACTGSSVKAKKPAEPPKEERAKRDDYLVILN